MTNHTAIREVGCRKASYKLDKMPEESNELTR